MKQLFTNMVTWIVVLWITGFGLITWEVNRKSTEMTTEQIVQKDKECKQHGLIAEIKERTAKGGVHSMHCVPSKFKNTESEYD